MNKQQGDRDVALPHEADRRAARQHGRGATDRSPLARRLGTLDAFASLSEGELTDLSRPATLRSVAAGAPVGTRAELGASVFVVLRGTVGIRVTTENGQHPLVLELGAGEAMSTTGNGRGKEVAADVIATAGQTEVCLLPASCFQRMCTIRPGVAARLLQQAWHRVLAGSAEHAELGSRCVAERVCRVLADLAERDPDHIVRITQERIADRAWTTREHVNRVLHDLLAGGLVEHAPFSREIRVPDPNRLRCLCG